MPIQTNLFNYISSIYAIQLSGLLVQEMIYVSSENSNVHLRTIQSEKVFKCEYNST